MNLKTIALLLGAIIAPAIAAPGAPPRGTVADKYIVTLKSDTPSPQLDTHVSWVRHHVKRRGLGGRRGGVEKVWGKSFKGYSGEFDAETIEEIRARDEVRCPYSPLSLHSYRKSSAYPFNLTLNLPLNPPPHTHTNTPSWQFDTQYPEPA